MGMDSSNLEKSFAYIVVFAQNFRRFGPARNLQDGQNFALSTAERESLSTPRGVIK